MPIGVPDSDPPAQAYESAAAARAMGRTLHHANRRIVVLGSSLAARLTSSRAGYSGNKG